MVRKSHGFKKGTRDLFKSRRRRTVNEKLQKFEVGSTVHIDIDPSSSSLVFRRFQGKTGKVVGTRGRAYIVEVMDGEKKKKIIALPEHLKIARGVKE